MIPKVIHYCWFGGGAESDVMQKCLASWPRVLPGYTIKRWDERNAPMRFPYLRTAAAQQKWSNMSNFVRLYALFSEGGIYLDTDVEVIRSLDDLLGLPAFLGCESREPVVNNAVYGSEAGHPFLLQMLSELTRDFDGLERSCESGPGLTTRLLSRLGLVAYQETQQTVADVVIFPTQYFHPFHYDESFQPECLTPSARTIHHWQKSWL